MKRQFLLVLAITVSGARVCAQEYLTTTYIEQTSISPKAGLFVGIQSVQGFEYGAFYQQSAMLESLMTQDQKNTLPRVYEKEFYGAFFSGPLLNTKRIDMKLNARAGIVNNEYFVITPSLLSRYKMYNGLGIDIGLGVRAFNPTLLSGLSFNF